MSDSSTKSKDVSSMPSAVVGSIVLAGALLALRVIDGLMAQDGSSRQAIMSSLAAIVAVLIVVGLIRRHRLAWQWARLMGLFSGGLALFVGTLMLTSNIQPIALMLLFGQAAAGLTIAYLMGLRASRAYYGLTCPKCGRSQVRADDFLFRRAKCARCRVTW